MVQDKCLLFTAHEIEGQQSWENVTKRGMDFSGVFGLLHRCCLSLQPSQTNSIVVYKACEHSLNFIKPLRAGVVVFTLKRRFTRSFNAYLSGWEGCSLARKSVERKNSGQIFCLVEIFLRLFSVLLMKENSQGDLIGNLARLRDFQKTHLRLKNLECNSY